MPETFDVTRDSFPEFGWSSAWGLPFFPRPGGMTPYYQLRAIEGYGLARPMNCGVLLTALATNNLSVIRFVSTLKLAASDLPISMSFTFIDNLVVQVDVLYFFFDAVPIITWETSDIINIPASRQKFNLPSPGDAPIPLTGGILGAVELTPFTTPGMKKWNPLTPAFPGQCGTDA